MSSSDPTPPDRRRLLGLAAALGVAPLLAGCFRPLYGPAALGAVEIAPALAAIEVTPGGGRFDHYLVTELDFALDGSGQATAPKTHRLTLASTTQLGFAVVDRVSTLPESAILTVSTRFRLERKEPLAVELEGEARVSVPYLRTTQRFANVRAARDAEIRAAKLLAEQIRTRIAGHFARARS